MTKSSEVQTFFTKDNATLLFGPLYWIFPSIWLAVANPLMQDIASADRFFRSLSASAALGPANENWRRRTVAIRVKFLFIICKNLLFWYEYICITPAIRGALTRASRGGPSARNRLNGLVKFSCG